LTQFSTIALPFCNYEIIRNPDRSRDPTCQLKVIADQPVKKDQSLDFSMAPLFFPLYQLKVG